MMRLFIVVRTSGIDDEGRREPISVWDTREKAEADIRKYEEGENPPDDLEICELNLNSSYTEWLYRGHN